MTMSCASLSFAFSLAVSLLFRLPCQGPRVGIDGMSFVHPSLAGPRGPEPRPGLISSAQKMWKEVGDGDQQPRPVSGLQNSLIFSDRR